MSAPAPGTLGAPKFETPTGLDWAALKAYYLAHCSPEEREGMATPTGRRGDLVAKKPKPQRAPAGPSSGQYAKTPPEVEDKVVELYNGGRGDQPGAISQTCGIHPATVRRILRSRDVYDPSMVRYGA